MCTLKLLLNILVFLENFVLWLWHASLVILFIRKVCDVSLCFSSNLLSPMHEQSSLCWNDSSLSVCTHHKHSSPSLPPFQLVDCKMRHVIYLIRRLIGCTGKEGYGWSVPIQDPWWMLPFIYTQRLKNRRKKIGNYEPNQTNTKWKIILGKKWINGNFGLFYALTVSTCHKRLHANAFMVRRPTDSKQQTRFLYPSPSPPCW